MTDSSYAHCANRSLNEKLLVVFRVSHESTPLTRRGPKSNDAPTHTWKVRVNHWNPAVQLKPLVERVTFSLHETFNNPERSINRDPFEICEAGYGNFVMAIEIVLTQGQRKIHIEHDLILDRNVSSFHGRIIQNATLEEHEKFIECGCFRLPNVGDETVYKVYIDSIINQLTQMEPTDLEFVGPYTFFPKESPVIQPQPIINNGYSNQNNDPPNDRPPLKITLKKQQIKPSHKEKKKKKKKEKHRDKEHKSSKRSSGGDSGVYEESSDLMHSGGVYPQREPPQLDTENTNSTMESSYSNTSVSIPFNTADPPPSAIAVRRSVVVYKGSDSKFKQSSHPKFRQVSQEIFEPAICSDVNQPIQSLPLAELAANNSLAPPPPPPPDPIPIYQQPAVLLSPEKLNDNIRPPLIHPVPDISEMDQLFEDESEPLLPISKSALSLTGSPRVSSGGSINGVSSHFSTNTLTKSSSLPLSNVYSAQIQSEKERQSLPQQELLFPMLTGSPIADGEVSPSEKPPSLPFEKSDSQSPPFNALSSISAMKPQFSSEINNSGPKLEPLQDSTHCNYPPLVNKMSPDSSPSTCTSDSTAVPNILPIASTARIETTHEDTKQERNPPVLPPKRRYSNVQLVSSDYNSPSTRSPFTQLTETNSKEQLNDKRPVSGLMNISSDNFQKLNDEMALSDTNSESIPDKLDTPTFCEKQAGPASSPSTASTLKQEALSPKDHDSISRQVSGQFSISPVKMSSIMTPTSSDTPSKDDNMKRKSLQSTKIPKEKKSKLYSTEHEPSPPSISSQAGCTTEDSSQENKEPIPTMSEVSENYHNELLDLSKRLQKKTRSPRRGDLIYKVLMHYRRHCDDAIQISHTTEKVTWESVDFDLEKLSNDCIRDLWRVVNKEEVIFKD